ncbi:MAG: LpxL/LpxP family Kdo(2)-lipid IV(A) lauroyl/palmitoleoyl acyltransferase [Woeseiaceae bacterium]|nr:LpxL/LpxP family Kdo(2)-lipid IV(A) lauroyl/palmitoleoyl acyltransferase [Woeseiaceae bacterium]
MCEYTSVAMIEDRKPLCNYRAPKYWPIWFAMGVLRLICLLPHQSVLAIGRILGKLAYYIAHSRRQIVKRNIELCFPEMSSFERHTLVVKHFKSLGIMLVEMGLGRWASDKYLQSITVIKGLEHLKKANKDGRGTILLSAHFTTLEISSRVLAAVSEPFDGVYRRNRSDFITEILRSGRERAVANLIEKRDIRKMVRNLRAGRTVWYAPDQSYNRKGAEIVNFFGIPTMHTTATSTLARLGKAVVIPFFFQRLPDGTYEITILAPLNDFPSEDPIADTRQYVSLLEKRIRICPEQYFWIHRKFKNLPDDYPDYYADLDASR